MTRRSLLRRLGLLTGAVVCAPLLPFTQAAVGITPAMATAIAAKNATLFGPELGVALQMIQQWHREHPRRYDGAYDLRPSRRDAFLAQPWMED